MDKRLIKQLSELINDRWNNTCSKIDIKRKINGIFSRKKNAAIISELSDLLKSVNGREKNIYTLIIVLALLRRNLDCADEIKDELVFEIKERFLLSLKLFLKLQLKTIPH